MMCKGRGNTLYLECYSGISGDMTVGALLDLGASQKVLEKHLRSLPVGGFEIKITRVKKSGLDACDFHVILDRKHENHDHDNDYLYAHEKNSHRNESHFHDHESHIHDHESHIHDRESHIHDHEGQGHENYIHDHESHIHGHEDHNHMHRHEHRGLPEIQDIISRSDMSKRAKKIASDIFIVLAEAEAKAHGVPAEEVHFHEVGAVDSIVDIAAAAICLDDLNITDVIVPELYEGRGTVRCQHGIIPVPVPAVINIVGSHHISLHMTQTEAELVTPTGAAIVAAIRTSDRLPDRYKICKIGMGAGKRDYGRTSILRGMLINPASDETDNTDITGNTDNTDITDITGNTDNTDIAGKTENTDITGNTENAGKTDNIWKLESNIDDSTGEALGYAMERLLEAGARDVYYTPVYMKKNRPAYQLNVICDEESTALMEEIIFRETTTIGIRKMKMQRAVMQREIRRVETSLGMAEVKVCRAGEIVKVYPEYESIVVICREKHMDFQDVWNRVYEEVKERLGE